MSAAPLLGKRIVVTRAQHQAGRLSEALRMLGAEVIELPLIEIIPPASYAQLDGALRQLNVYQWLIVTSANTVRVLVERAGVLDIPISAFAHMKTVAIGSATSAAMCAVGLAVNIIPERYVAESVIAALGKEVSGAKILLARARIARDTLPDELTNGGAEVDIVEAYQTVIPAGTEARIRELFSAGASVPDAVTFTSSSTVKHFAILLEQAGIQVPPAGVQALSIGPITSATLRDLGWEPAIQAKVYDVPGLVTAAQKTLGLC